MKQIIIFDLNTGIKTSNFSLESHKSLCGSRCVAQLTWLSAEIINLAGRLYYRPDTLQASFCETAEEEDDVVRDFDHMLLEQAFNEGTPRLVGFNTRERGMPTLIARARAKAISVLAGDDKLDLRNISYLAGLNADEHCDLFRLASIFRDAEAVSLAAICRSLNIPLLPASPNYPGFGSEDRQSARLYHEFRVLSIWLVFLNWALASGELTAEGYAASLRATLESIDAAAEQRPEFGVWTTALRTQSNPVFSSIQN